MLDARYLVQSGGRSRLEVELTRLGGCLSFMQAQTARAGEHLPLRCSGLGYSLSGLSSCMVAQPPARGKCRGVPDWQGHRA
jgi:hypothetical protein